MAHTSSLLSSLGAELGQMKVAEQVLKAVSTIVIELAIIILSFLIFTLLGFLIWCLFKGKVKEGILEILGAFLSQNPNFGLAASLALKFGAYLPDFAKRHPEKLPTLPKSFSPEQEDRLDVRSDKKAKEERKKKNDEKISLVEICIEIGFGVITIGSTIISIEYTMITFMFSKEKREKIKDE